MDDDTSNYLPINPDVIVRIFCVIVYDTSSYLALPMNYDSVVRMFLVSICDMPTYYIISYQSCYADQNVSMSLLPYMIICSIISILMGEILIKSTMCKLYK